MIINSELESVLSCWYLNLRRGLDLLLKFARFLVVLLILKRVICELFLVWAVVPNRFPLGAKEWVPRIVPKGVWSV